MMKKIMISTITGLAMVVMLMTGCGQSGSKPVPAPQVNPQASASVISQASPVCSPKVAQGVPKASTYSPPGTQGTPESNSDVLQNNIPLKVTNPADGADVNTDTIAVKGQTVPAATVSVNDVSGVADASGNFNISISLEQGLNAIDVISSDDSGKEGEVLILVNVVSSGSPAAISQADQPGVSPGSIPLTVTQPADGATVNSNAVTVKGQTAQGATVVINDQIETADTNGNFSFNVSLVPGPNVIDVTAQDDNGNDNEVLIMVNAAP
jgi:hypothetical protein